MLNNEAKKILTERLEAIENHLQADLISFSGPILNGIENNFKRIIEGIDNKKEKIYVILTTNGGSAHVTERMVTILRKNYKEVNFIIPDYAYSAGTIFCMSGDNILMNYFSVLGPIDPQVPNKEGKYVPALGYLSKVEDLINLAREEKISQAEFLILKDFDLAELKGYEQARDLTVDLLKEWLVKYKFKNWNISETTQTTITQSQKEERAEEIAKMLGDYNTWKSHSRPLDINILRNKIKLKIEDYAVDQNLNHLIDNYYILLQDFLNKNGYYELPFFHTRRFI